MHRSRFMRFALPVAIVAIVLAGCGSDSTAGEASAGDTAATSAGDTAATSAGDTAATSAGGTAAPSGEDIKIMALMTISSSQYGFPQQAAAIKARAEAINADGGVNGRKIVVTECNDALDVNEATACAKKAVSEGFAAVVGGTAGNGEAIVNVLERGNVAYVGQNPFRPVEFTSPISFPLVGGAAVLYGGLGETLISHLGCTNPGAMPADNEGAKAITETYVIPAMKFSGATDPPTYAVAATGDALPAATALKSKGVDCIYFGAAPLGMVKWVQAVRQVDPNIKIDVGSDSTPADAIEQLGPLAEGLVIGYAAQPASADVPGAEQFRQEMAKYASSEPADSAAMQSWLGMKVVGDVLAGMSGDITAETFLAAISKATNVDTGGITPPLDFTKGSTVPGFNRVFNTHYILTEVKNGELTILGDYDASPLLESLANK